MIAVPGEDHFYSNASKAHAVSEALADFIPRTPAEFARFEACLNSPSVRRSRHLARRKASDLWVPCATFVMPQAAG
jgi:hypothetical protein